MKKLISIILCSIFISCTFTFKEAQAVKFNKSFSETFTDVEETFLFCGEPVAVAYYMGYNYALLPVSIGIGRDDYNNKNRTVFFAANPDLSTIAVMMVYDDKVCVQSISIGHKPYEEKK